VDKQHSLSVILLAGGLGSRIPTAQPKQFTPLQGKPLAKHSFDVLLTVPVQEFVVVCPEEYQHVFASSTHSITFTAPGKERMFSLANGLKELKKPVDFILTHDAARPFLQQDDLSRLLTEGFAIGAATLASPMTSTIKRTNQEQFVIETLPREHLWDIQTPQLTRYSLLKEGLDLLLKGGLYVTDEMGIAERLSHPVKIIQGSALNFKVTTMKDLLLAQMVAAETGAVS
jgi:2-C-methyl-D-erythritol 4-phosphate cytidylyltransferase